MTIAEFYAKYGDQSFFEYDRNGQSDFRYKGQYLYQVLLNYHGYDGYLVVVGEEGDQQDSIELAEPEDRVELTEDD